MADNSFGVTELNLIGSSGTPKIESPNNLNLNAVNVAISTNATVGGNLNVSGTLTGDGSGLTGVVGSGSGIVIKHDGSTVGTAGTIDFSTNLDVSAISGAAVTITASSGGIGTDGSINTTGIITASQFHATDKITVGSGATIEANGQANFTGIITSKSSILVEGGNVTVDIGSLNQGFYLYNGGSTHLGLSWSSSASKNYFTGNGSHELMFDDFTQVTIDTPLTVSGGNDFKVGTGATIEPNGQASFAGFVTCTDAIGFGTQIDGVITGIGTTAISIGLGSTVIYGAPGIAYSGSKIVLTDRLGVSEGGRFDVLLSDQTYNGIGHTALSIYKSGNSNSFKLFEKNTSAVSNIEIHTNYSGSNNNAINFITNNSQYKGQVNYNAALGWYEFYITNGGTTYKPLTLQSNGLNLGDNMLIYPTTNNGAGIGNTNYRFSNLRVTDIDAVGIATATGFRSSTTTGNGSDIAYAIKYYITANGSSAYRFAGAGVLNSTDDPTLYFHRGFTYILENSTGGSHPFELRVSDGGSAYAPGGQFLTGSTTGTQILTVPMDAPASIVYQCTIHSSMLGTINFVQ